MKRKSTDAAEIDETAAETPEMSEVPETNSRDVNLGNENKKKEENTSFFIHYFFGINTSVPPIYGCNGFGIETVPSAFRLFSKNAINIRGGATTVLFKVCAK